MFSLCGWSYRTVRPNYVKHSLERKVQHFLNVASFIERHAPLQQLSILINLQALSQRPQPFWMTPPCFRHKSHLPQTKLTPSGFRIAAAPRQSNVCLWMWVCVHARAPGSAAPVPVCVAVSFEYRFGGLMRAWDSGAHSGESFWDIYYALHQSFWTLDISLAEQIVSYQNSISEMTCWNSLPSTPPPPPLPTAQPTPLPPPPPAALSGRLFASTCTASQWIFSAHVQRGQMKFSPCPSPASLFLCPTSSYRQNSLAMVVFFPPFFFLHAMS